MVESSNISEGLALLLVGSLLLAGYAAHHLGRRVHVPRVTLLILIGVIMGPYVLDLVPESLASWFPYVAHFALAMVGFLLGESFTGKNLRNMGRNLLLLPLVYVLFTALLVFLVTLAVGGSIVTALLLAGIAPASDPAATIDIVREMKAKGPLPKTLLQVVAIDDVFGVMLFTLLLAAAEFFIGTDSISHEILLGLWEIVGAVFVGVALGFPMAWCSGRLQKGEPAILEAAGFVFFCGGIASIFDVSYLLACMVIGTVVANRAKHHTRPFHAIEGASDPFLSLFFVLAGFRLEIEALTGVGILGLAYITSRSMGLIIGGRIGAKICRAPNPVQKHLGWCLLPQAGVALGLALLTYEKLPTIGEQLLPLVIATIIIFELFGPLSTQYHLKRAANES